jgi:FkbM family methyltransferase
MVDVGAHFGSTFKPYLKLGWRVIACEPDSEKHDKLRKHADNPRFTLVTDAVGEIESSSAAFYTSPESTGISSLVPFR